MFSDLISKIKSMTSKSSEGSSVKGHTDSDHRSSGSGCSIPVSNLGESSHECGCGKKTSQKMTTTIIAEVDVGFGNTLYVRGEGAGSHLSWDKGLKMKNLSHNTWMLKVDSTDNLSFKFLINDEIWSTADNCIACKGCTSISKPSF